MAMFRSAGPPPYLVPSVSAWSMSRGIYEAFPLAHTYTTAACYSCLMWNRQEKQCVVQDNGQSSK